MTFEAVLVEVSVVPGAAIRLNSEKPGIRFIANVDNAGYNAIKKYAKDVKVGTLIASTTALKRAGLSNNYTLDAVNRYNETADKLVKLANAEATYFYNGAATQSGDHDFRTVLIVPTTTTDKQFFTVDWAARSYAKVTYTNDESDYIYAAYNEEEHARSLKEVATAVQNNNYAGCNDDEAQKAIINAYAADYSTEQ